MWFNTACLMFASLALSSGQETQETPTPTQILERMAKVCAECKTYRDSGVVTTVFVYDTGRRRTDRKPFTTAFVGPDRFRFEFKSRSGEDEFDRYLVWRNGDEVKTWWDVRPGVDEERSINLAIAGATGVSGGSAHTIPVLLMPGETDGRRLTNLTELTMADDGEIGAAKCYRILSGESMTLWIDKETSLLRRIEERKQFDDFKTESTTDYEPEINVQIPEALLAFDPPEPEKR